MAYAYEDLDDSQFERLVVQCAKKLFGAGVQAFATGPDGGRDARFHGTAERFPSTAAPWTGVTVIQAKHTIAVNAHFSSAEFGGTAASSVISKEEPRIRALTDAGEAENYILFSNRRLGGVTGPALVKRIAVSSGLPPQRVHVAGVEYIDDLIREFPEILALARIDPVDGPLLVSSFDLAEVILAIADELNATSPLEDDPIVERVHYADKNDLNNMSDEFANILGKRYLVYTRQIERFLADPGNSETLRRYEAAVDEYQLKIVDKRADYQSFEAVFNYLVDSLRKRDPVLAARHPLLRALLFYMYWHCDIGKVAADDANSQ